MKRLYLSPEFINERLGAADCAQPPEYDVRVDDHGSICLVRPISNRAHSWLDDNVSADAMWFGGALVVEPRYVSDLVVGMAAAGFCISGGRAVR